MDDGTARKLFGTLAALIAILLLGISPGSSADEAPGVRIVALVQLIVDPPKFDNVRVRTVGYLAFDGSIRLYLTEDHADLADSPSSLAVDGTNGEQLVACTGAYVSIVGTLGRDREGAFELTQIEEVVRRSGGKVPWSSCWRTTPD